MPILAESAVPGVHVGPSALFELMWVQYHAEFRQPIEGPHAELEPVRRRFGPELARLKADGLPQPSSELVVLADRCGALLGPDLAGFFESLDAAITERSSLPSLRSESPAEVETTRRRLDGLRADPGKRRFYVELLRGLWASVEPGWKDRGQSAVLEKADRWTRALAGGTSFRQLLGTAQLWPSRPEIDAFADEAAVNGRLFLTPCWFGGRIHVVELNGLVYLGAGIRAVQHSYREIAATVSANIKALADPTRLAILLSLARQPASVSELARQFGLSQPAMSGHVQVLREAGLLGEKTVGRRAILSTNEDRVLQIFSDAGTSIQKVFSG
jgi:ArsR family transcriptional regulator, zinc-responsive transcriptional repressor